MARVLVAGSDDVRRAVEAGLGERLHERCGPAATLEVEPIAPARAADVLEWVGRDGPGEAAALVTSVVPDVVAGEGSPEDTRDALVATAAALERAGAALLVFNGSSFDPGDRTHRLAAGPEPPTLRTHRFNLALIDASRACGLGVVDVDSLVAEAGGARHVHGLFAYSGHLHALACAELAQQLADRGVGRSRSGVLALAVPRYDRRVVEVALTRWHKRAGEEIAYGDALVEVRADNLGWRLDGGQAGGGAPTQRSLDLLVRAGAPGVLRTTSVDEGAAVRVGDPIGVVTAGPVQDPGAGADADPASAPRFPATVSALSALGDEPS